MTNVSQTSLVFEEGSNNGPVLCLGMKFKNDDERREYFRAELKKKLPELKKVDGYPIGEDADIIELSDPPYYTACPNPWINEFMSISKKANESSYHKEPFTADVSEGKADPIYNTHSYHTKVPHKAIMRYILHYTNPGDIVFDGFSGTGMTGVAAKLCNDKNEIKKLGYTIENENIYDENGKKISELGTRRVVLNDISTSAALISHNYNYSFSKDEFKSAAENIISELEDELHWMYTTEISDSNDKKQIVKTNYTVWSDVFSCPTCSSEIIYWDVAVDIEKQELNSKLRCNVCESEIDKRNLNRVFENKFDSILGRVTKVAKQVPVLINYTFQKKRYNKQPDKYDLDLIKKIEDMNFSEWVPSEELPKGDKTNEPIRMGLTHVHHFYTKRNLIFMAKFIKKIERSKFRQILLGLLRGSTTYSNRMVKVNVPRLLDKGGIYAFGFVSGTLYIPSLNGERPIIEGVKSKVNSILQTSFDETNENTIITNQSSDNVFQIPGNSIDYIFVDPPFGANLMYSELNYYWESWLKVWTNNRNEAIINKEQKKQLEDYRDLMYKCFSENYRILKPGRWMTVEFSNSQASVWNSIREAIEKAGFIIADVSSLDKKQGSFNAITSTTAVKQDLVISVYKPTEEMQSEMQEINNNINDSTWVFVKNHLEQLPVFIGNKDKVDVIVERTPRILFDRMVAYHVQNGIQFNISSAEFQNEVAQRFPMRDGMAFLESQVAEYDRKRTSIGQFVQMNLFVSDENSAIEWLRQKLLNRPQTRQDLHPNFMKEIQHIAKHELLPELDALLEQNFLIYDNNEEVPSQIHGYLSSNYKDLRGLQKTDSRLKEKAKNRWYVPDHNKQADLEKLREKSLLREFDSYKTEIEGNKKKLKQFRTESIRTGFKKAWSEKDYETIVKIGERLPEKVLQEDDKLLMYFDNAQIRLGV
ncbi:DNA methyltransferase [Rossellomorea vietnamensis]|uniref:DNA methyltransferase n=1 Tax=Rossellomorea vietnamensis TaxID=218284 RepID=UPI003CFB5644